MRNIHKKATTTMKFHTSFGIAIILVIASVHLAYGANGGEHTNITYCGVIQPTHNHNFIRCQIFSILTNGTAQLAMYGVHVLVYDLRIAIQNFHVGLQVF